MDPDLGKALGIIEDVNEREVLTDIEYKELLDLLMAINKKLPQTRAQKREARRAANPYNDPMLLPFIQQAAQEFIGPGILYQGEPPAQPVLPDPLPTTKIVQFDQYRIHFYKILDTDRNLVIPPELREPNRDSLDIYHIRSYHQSGYQDYIINPDTACRIVTHGDRCKRVFQDRGIDYFRFIRLLSVSQEELEREVRPRVRVQARPRVRARARPRPQPVVV